MLFKHKTKRLSYDPDCKIPVIKASICNGEQVAGFKDIKTGAFEEIMLISNDGDLGAGESFNAGYEMIFYKNGMV